jgi:hypothetical protein
MKMTRCPFLSTPHAVSGCIGSECACWRTMPPTTPETGAQRAIVADDPTARREEDAGPKPPVVPEGWAFVPYDGESPAGWIEPIGQARARLVGYCGVAGALSGAYER